MAEYQWGKSYRGYKHIEPDIVARELAKLDASGGVTASRVVEAARPAKAPLHPEFTWDQAKAAREYNLIEARRLITAVERVLQPGRVDHPRETEILYWHLPNQNPNKEGTYVSPGRLRESASSLLRVLQEVSRYLAAAERRMQEVRQLSEGKGEPVLAQVAAINEGLHILRTGLEALSAAA